MQKIITAVLTAVLAGSAPAAAQTAPDLSGALRTLKSKTAEFSNAVGKRGSGPALKAAAQDQPGDDALREMTGIRLERSNRTYDEYSIRGEERFLISNRNFATRTEALNFCSGMRGWRLANPTMAMFLTMAGLPFPTLRKNARIEERLIGGRTGTMFWVRGDDRLPESTLGQAENAVYLMVDGCGPNCETIASLDQINRVLSQMGKSPRRLQAVCAQESSADF